MICQRHQTILRFLSTAATASTRWRVRELYCQTSYINRTGNVPSTAYNADHPNTKLSRNLFRRFGAVFQAIKRVDQLLPYYVMDVAGFIPGLPGLFIAGVFCAALR
jgi:hypothetical protein